LKILVSSVVHAVRGLQKKHGSPIESPNDLLLTYTDIGETRADSIATMKVEARAGVILPMIYDYIAGNNRVAESVA
jgi:hypothetical protein